MGNASQDGNGTNGKHTASGSNRIVVVFVEEFPDTSEHITNITYDYGGANQAVTKLSGYASANHYGSYWYLVAPTANPLDRTRSASRACTSSTML